MIKKRKKLYEKMDETVFQEVFKEVKEMVLPYVGIEEIDDFEFGLRDWRVRFEGSRVYLVKNVKSRGFVKDYQKVKLIVQECLEKHEYLEDENIDLEFVVDEVMNRLFHRFLEDEFQFFVDEEYVPFVKNLGMYPVIVGRSGGWWGVELTDMYSEDIFDLDMVCVRKMLDWWVQNYLDGDEWRGFDSFDIADTFLTDIEDGGKNIRDCLVINDEFLENVKKIDKFLEDNITEFENPDNWVEVINDICTEVLEDIKLGEE